MPRSTSGGSGGKPTPKGVAVGRKLTAQAHRKEIEHHVREYAKAPRKHAKALRDLGLDSKQIRYVHRSSQGLNPKGARHPIKPATGKAAGFVGLGSKIGEDFANAAIYSPVGAYRVLEAGAKDVASTARGKPTLKHSARITKDIGKGVYQDFRHPGRHPGNLILDIGALVGAGEGAVARAGAASKAVKVGEGARKAVTRKGREGGGVIHRPTTGRIQHEVVGEHGKMTVETPASKRAGVAAIQRRRAAKASAGPKAEKVAGKALTKERRITEAVERAPIEALAHKSRRLSTPQQTALRVYNEGKSIPERVSFHEGHRDKAGRGTAGHVRHQQKVLLLKAAANYLEHEPPAVPSGHIRLYRGEGKTAPVDANAIGDIAAMDRGNWFADTRAVAEEYARRNNGRLYYIDVPEDTARAWRRARESDAGQRWAEYRFPAKYGFGEKKNLVEGGPRLRDVASATSKQERRQLARLHDAQASLERVAKTREERLAALGKLEEGRIEARLHGPGRVIAGATFERPSRKRGQIAGQESFGTGTRFKTTARPRTIEEAKARLADLDEHYNEILGKIAGKMPGYLNLKQGVGGKGKRAEMRAKLATDRAGKIPTPRNEALRIAEERLWRQIDQHPEHPVSAKYRALLAERAQLQEALNEHALGGTRNLGMTEEAVPVTTTAKRAVRRAGLVGAEDFKGGRARIPYTPTEAPRAHGSPANYRGGIPQTPGSLTHEFKGGLLHSGNFREDTARLVAESGVEAQRHTAVVRLRDRVATAARDTPREGDIAIRLDGLKGKPFPSNVQAVLRKREEGVKLTRTESQLLRDELEKVREEVFPQIDPHEHGQHPDVRWINPELLDGAQQQAYKLSGAIGERPVEVIDAINNASKLAILYLKPAYAVPNIAGNAFLNIVQQGVLAPANWTRSGHLYRKLGDDAAATLDSVMGEGLARSLSTGEGAGQKAVAGIAGGWSKVVDLIFRRAAFIHEARRIGYKGPADLKKLLTDEAHRADLQEVAQRAKDAIIDYDNLGQREKELVRRVVFFYPWVKGSTMYAGHFALEHPIQTGAVGALGEYGKENTGLGPSPSYLQGSFKAGGRLVNPISAAVFQTPAQVYQALHALQHGKVTEAARLGSFATPAVELAISEIARTDNFGNTISPRKSGLDVAKESLVNSLPQVLLAQRLQRAGGKGEKNRLFPIEGKGDALGPFGIGGLYPRRYNPEQLAQQARREERSLHGRSENTVNDYRQAQKDLTAAFRKVGEKRIPRAVAGRLMLKRERHFNRLRASGGHDMTSAEAFGADMDLLVRHKWVSPAEARHAKVWADKAPKRDVSNALGYLTRNYFDADGLLSDSLKYLRENGSPDVRVPSLP